MLRRTNYGLIMRGSVMAADRRIPLDCQGKNSLGLELFPGSLFASGGKVGRHDIDVTPPAPQDVPRRRRRLLFDGQNPPGVISVRAIQLRRTFFSFFANTAGRNTCKINGLDKAKDTNPRARLTAPNGREGPVH